MDDSRWPLLRLKSSQAKERLGMFVVMDGSSKDQNEYLLGNSWQIVDCFEPLK